VLPVNYYGQDRIHKNIPFESLEVFTIENVKEGSRWYEPLLMLYMEISIMSNSQYCVEAEKTMSKQHKKESGFLT